MDGSRTFSSLLVNPAWRLGCFGLVALLLPCVLYLAFLCYPNFHPVIEQRFYRSGQLSAKTLRSIIQRENIATVINLRGRHPDATWWRWEKAVCANLGVHHIDLAWDAAQALSDDQIRQFLDLLRETPESVLVHCKHGADRASLASALILAEFARQSYPQCRKQFSIRYGHLPLLLPGVKAMDETFERWMIGR